MMFMIMMIIINITMYDVSCMVYDDDDADDDDYDDKDDADYVSDDDNYDV